MTEAEWLADTDLGVVWEYVEGNASERKARLLGCACIQRALRVIPGEHYQAALDIAVRYADGAVGEAELVATAANFPHQLGDIAGYLFMSILSPTTSTSRVVIGSAVYSADAVSGASLKAHENFRHSPTWKAELESHSLLLRDIFGNPFRPIPFDPAWRSDTALSLARQMYDSRDFGAMPILADALQDVGCEHEEILNHCRDANTTHVRGCWVVDLVLGKT